MGGPHAPDRFDEDWMQMHRDLVRTSPDHLVSNAILANRSVCPHMFRRSCDLVRGWHDQHELRDFADSEVWLRLLPLGINQLSHGSRLRVQQGSEMLQKGLGHGSGVAMSLVLLIADLADLGVDTRQATNATMHRMHVTKLERYRFIVLRFGEMGQRFKLQNGLGLNPMNLQSFVGINHGSHVVPRSKSTERGPAKLEDPTTHKLLPSTESNNTVEFLILVLALKRARLRMMPWRIEAMAVSLKNFFFTLPRD